MPLFSITKFWLGLYFILYLWYNNIRKKAVVKKMSLISEVQKLLSQKKIEDAENLIKNHKEEIDYDNYHAYLGLCLEMKHQYEDATNEYYKVQYVGEKVSSKFYHFHLATCLNALGKPKQALAHLVEIEHYLSKKDIALSFQFYVTYNMLEDDQKAKPYIEHICKITKDPFYQIRYANVLNNLGYFKKAYEIEKKIYKKHPEDPFVIRELSSSSYNLKNYQEAEIYLKKLIEMGEYTDWDCLYLANIYILNDQYEQVLEVLKKVKDMNAHVYVKYAYCYSRLGKEKKAIYYYQEAITKDPKNIIGISSFAAFYRENRKFEEALKTLREYQKKNPEYKGRIYYEIAKVESDQEDYKKAITYLKKAEKVEEHPLIYCDLAWNYKQLGKLEEEKEALENASKWIPKDGWVLLEFGTCLLQLGDYEQALEKYSQINFDNFEIDWNRFFYEVGVCHEMLGNNRVAKEFFLKVSEKESYTYGHLVKCSLELNEVEDAITWSKKIDFSKEKDPWFLEIHLDLLEKEKKVLELEEVLEKNQTNIPRLLYLYKKVFLECEFAMNKEDSHLKKALSYQKEIQKIEGINADNILKEASILNRMGNREEAKACLKESEKLETPNRILKREWIYNYLLSDKKEDLETAHRLAVELYQDTGVKEDALLIVLSDYKKKNYKRALLRIKNLKKQGFISESMEIIRGICYYKIGLKSYGNRILKPYRKDHDLIKEFLKEGRKSE